MEFHYDEIDSDVLIIAADGGLNADTAEQFVSSIEKLIDGGVSRIIIDCAKLTTITSYGLGVLIRLHNRMKQRGGDVKIAAVGGLVPQVLQLTKLNELFDIHPDVNRAKLAFRPRNGVDSRSGEH
jgi:anti-sigma B factor antagonist